MRREKIGLKSLGIKAIIYRVFVTLSMIGVVYLLTRDFTLSTSVSIIWNIVNTVEYYLFDIAWFRIIRLRPKIKERKIEKGE